MQPSLTKHEASRVISGGFCQRYPQLVQRQDAASFNQRVAVVALLVLNVAIAATVWGMIRG